MPSTDIVTAAVLVIGDEILSGRTKDKNSGTIASHLTEIGIRLREVRVVADIETEIVAALDALRARYTYVFTTGGIGPTHDDITADAVAKAFGVSIGVSPDAEAILKTYYDGRGLELTDARRRMARIPAGASLVENRISGAPGFMLGNVIVMAGIPDIMAVMLEAVTPLLETGARMLTATLLINRPESEIAATLEAHQRRYPDVAMGCYPFLFEGRPASELVLRSTSPKRLDDAAAMLQKELNRLA